MSRSTALDVHVPLVGRSRSFGGRVIDVTGEVGTGKVDVTRVDLPFTAEAEALAATAGATVDRAIVALRVRGNSRQLALSGDVDVVSAHVKAERAQGRRRVAAAARAATSKGPARGSPRDRVDGAWISAPLAAAAPSTSTSTTCPTCALDVDMHVGGTVKKPSISGTQHGANVWTSFVLTLAGLFS